MIYRILNEFHFHLLFAHSIIKEAISVGYRHIDTADAYGNHKVIGEGLNIILLHFLKELSFIHEFFISSL